MIEVAKPVTKKKRGKKKRAAGPRPNGDSADDGVVLLSAFNNLLSCLKATHPFLRAS